MIKIISDLKATMTGQPDYNDPAGGMGIVDWEIEVSYSGKQSKETQINIEWVDNVTNSKISTQRKITLVPGLQLISGKCKLPRNFWACSLSETVTFC